MLRRATARKSLARGSVGKYTPPFGGNPGKVQIAWIGHGHKTVDLVVILNHLAHVIVQARREAHLAGWLADLITPLAQFAKMRSASVCPAACSLAKRPRGD